jgi:hypothetical protein
MIFLRRIDLEGYVLSLTITLAQELIPMAKRARQLVLKPEGSCFYNWDRDVSLLYLPRSISLGLVYRASIQAMYSIDKIVP